VRDLTQLQRLESEPFAATLVSIPRGQNDPAYADPATGGKVRTPRHAQRQPAQRPSAGPRLVLVDDTGNIRGDGPVQSETALPSLNDAYREHSVYVANLALKLSGNDADVDDIVHDVFIRCMQSMHQVRRPGSLRAWLGTVTVRVVYRRFRSRRWHMRMRRSSETSREHLTTREASPEDLALLDEVYGVLRQLKPAQRIAWTLRYVEGETVPRVAEMCGCSLAAAKRRIAAAHKRIREALEDG